jgi:hypothetical protein
VPNTHYRSTRVLRHPTKTGAAVVIVLVVSTMTWIQFGISPGRASITRSQGPVVPIAKHATSAVPRTKLATAPVKSTVTVPVLMKAAAVAIDATPTTSYVVSLIKKSFPPTAWHAAEVVAWCESKFHPLDIHYDSNGTHDRGLFQLNDGGTEQYLLQRLGFNPNNVGLAFNPGLNVRAAALLYARDGWSQWTCASAL